MSKKDKHAEDYEKLQREIVRDKISEVIKKNPANFREGLKEIGFTWYDDDYPSEETEEATAVPENDNQQQLVDYFECTGSFSDSLLSVFSTERNSDTPNYPLMRRYFRAGSQPLKELILFGLEKDPTSYEYLCDLAFFHEFNNVLTELIDRFTKACQRENDLQDFSELAQEFYYTVIGDGYDALQALTKIFDEESDKWKIIDFLITEIKNADEGEISF